MHLVHTKLYARFEILTENEKSLKDLPRKNDEKSKMAASMKKVKINAHINKNLCLDTPMFYFYLHRFPPLWQYF